MARLWMLLAALMPAAAAAQAPGAARASGSDSMRAIAAGVRALGGRQPARWKVGLYARDSAGVTLSLFRPCPKPLVCQGGGGRVRVPHNGRVVVLERYR